MIGSRYGSLRIVTRGAGDRIPTRDGDLAHERPWGVHRAAAGLGRVIPGDPGVPARDRGSPGRYQAAWQALMGTAVDGRGDSAASLLLFGLAALTFPSFAWTPARAAKKPPCADHSASEDPRKDTRWDSTAI